MVGSFWSELAGFETAGHFVDKKHGGGFFDDICHHIWGHHLFHDFFRFILFSGSSTPGLGPGSGPNNHMRVCVGCGGQIHDQFILRVAPNLEWHAACLKCCQCQKFLDEKCTCFVRDGKIYCKDDYVR